MTDLARGRAATGARTWFVEEPMTGDVDEPRLEHEERDGVTRIWLVVPAAERAAEVHLGFAADGSEQYGSLVADLIAKQGRSPAPDVWLYTPMALDVAERLEPGRLIYDVMDDLASFRSAPQALVLSQRRALTEADLVFAGGRSLPRQ